MTSNSFASETVNHRTSSSSLPHFSSLVMASATNPNSPVSSILAWRATLRCSRVVCKRSRWPKSVSAAQRISWRLQKWKVETDPPNFQNTLDHIPPEKSSGSLCLCGENLFLCYLKTSLRVLPRVTSCGRMSPEGVRCPSDFRACSEYFQPIFFPAHFWLVGRSRKILQKVPETARPPVDRQQSHP